MITNIVLDENGEADVDATILKIHDLLEYKKMGIDQRKEIWKAVLNKLQKDGKIGELGYDDELKQYYFSYYDNGNKQGHGVISLKDFEPYFN